MTDSDEHAPGLLLAADHLEEWADALPKQSVGDDEPWYEFAERRYAAEVALIGRLGQAPNYCSRPVPCG